MREIRPADARDLDLLEGIEAEGDELFAGLFGHEPFGPDSAEDGRWRAAQPGFVLVCAQEPGGEAIGFAHVLDPAELGAAGICHLEQLAVRTGHARRGHGRALVAAARSEAARRGRTLMTLRTYANVPWNAPFYAACGFIVVEDPAEVARTAVARSFLEELSAAEQHLGLFAHGPRVLMAAPL